jgi:hypothetical protein
MVIANQMRCSGSDATSEIIVMSTIHGICCPIAARYKAQLVAHCIVVRLGSNQYKLLLLYPEEDEAVDESCLAAVRACARSAILDLQFPRLC